MAIFEFKLPELGEGIFEGEIVKWHVQPGEQVEEDQIILEVQNDKAVVEVPSPVDGIVKEIVVAEGTVANVGDTLITFEVEGGTETSVAQKDDSGDQVSTKATSPNSEIEKEQIEKSPTEDRQESEMNPQRKKQILATPSVRKLARELDIDITQVTGTGRHGQVTKEDLYQFRNQGMVPETSTAPVQETETKPAQPVAPPSTSTVPEEERVPLRGIRKVIAEAMVKSVYTAPHVTIMDQVDVSKLVDFRQRMKPLAEQKGVKLTYLPFIVKALIAALRQFPELNATFDEEKEEIIFKKSFHIGIATDTDNGLLVPVIFDADRKNMWQIAEEIDDLATRAREGKLAPTELKGSTMTITNIGSAGGLFFTPVINFPEVAILGIGRIMKQPVVKHDAVAIASVMALSLSFDHRFIDGATAQYFINYVKQVLEDPEIFILEV